MYSPHDLFFNRQHAWSWSTWMSCLSSKGSWHMPHAFCCASALRYEEPNKVFENCGHSRIRTYETPRL
jgi:hypothetical protein